jgi:hypothetical protein
MTEFFARNDGVLERNSEESKDGVPIINTARYINQTALKLIIVLE